MASLLQNNRRLRLGIGLPTTLAMVAIGTIVGVAFLGASTTSAKITHRAEGYVQATALAESGVNILYSQIKAEMVASNTYPATLAATNAMVSGKTVGTYAARVLGMQETSTPTLDPGGEVTGEVRTYRFSLEGTGQATKGPSAVVKCEFTGTVKYAAIGGQGASLGLKAGAIIANDKISMVTDSCPGGIRTEDLSGGHQAHMIANNGITWMPLSQPKVCTYSTDWIQVDGGYLVPDSAYDWTVGFDGLGNGNASKNYLSQELTESDYYHSVAANEVGRLVTEYQFPNGSQVDHYADVWLKSATKGTTHAGGVVASTLSPDPNLHKVVLKAPCVVDGNLDVDAVLSLIPNPDPVKNVIYVKGNISVSARLKNLGVTLVADGRYVDGNSGGYDLEAAGTDVDGNGDGNADTQPDSQCASWGISTVRRKASMMILAATQSAVTFNSVNPGELGLVFAMRGGISAKSPNANLQGMLMAGGVGSLGSIEILPNSGAAFKTSFLPDYAATRTWGSSEPPVLQLSDPFAAQRLTKWLQIR